jgi:hypothetical protein
MKFVADEEGEMPLIAINLSDKLFIVIRELVEQGHYQNFESFLEVAAYNQLALERGASPADVLARGHREGEPAAGNDSNGGKPRRRVQRAEAEAAPRTRKDDNPRSQKRSAGRVTRQTVVLNETIPEDDPTTILKPFRLVVASPNGPKPYDPTQMDEAGDDHVFGQVNRLFPLKIACRWLATRVFGAGDGGNKEWPVYTAISDALGGDAAKLGSLLEKRDVTAGRKRDDQVATGLPRRGNSASQDRFLSQFLARVTRTGEVYPGAVCQYQLAGFQDRRLGLTEQGLAFAQLHNPNLDSADAMASDALGQEEADFLIRQVLAGVPCEREDMRIVLSAVADGKVTPSHLIQEVQVKFPRKWTQSMVLTHISGLVARLADLRLLRRQWQGRNVQYELGERQRVDSFLKV